MKKAVQKYLENRCTPEEAEKVLRWLQTEEGEAFLKEQVATDSYLFFNTPDSDLYPELDSSLLFDEIIRKKASGAYPLPGKKKNSRSQRRKNKRKINRFRGISALAAATLFLIVAILVYNLQYDEPLPEEFGTYQVIETERGEQKTLRLRDGSEVFLNHDSSISIPNDFSETNRQLVLEGEAWFEVNPHAAHPFIITGPNSVIRVLGTSFSVNSHSGDNQTHVVVETGRLAFGAREDTTVQEKIIEKKQGGLYKTGNEIELQNISNMELFTGWKDGKLIFHKTPFAEVVQRLERWYDIDCIISDDAIKKEHFTSVFEDESLLHVLDVIALSMNISYEIENQTINFKTDNL